MKPWFPGFFAVALMLPARPMLAAEVTYGSMRNGSFDEKQTHQADDPGVAEARKVGWTLPGDLVWPAHWGPNPSTGNSSLEYLPQGGLKGSPAVRLDGGGHIASYFGRPEPGRPYLASVRVKGEGEVWFGVYQYSQEGFIRGYTLIERKIQTPHWVEYRGLFPNDQPEITSINPALGGKGPIEVDEVQLVPAEPVDVEMVREFTPLYDTGALIESLEIQAVQVDETFASRLTDYDQAVALFREKAAGLDHQLAPSIEQKIASLEPYLQTAGQKTVLPSAYNEMIVLTRVLQRLAGEPVGPAATVQIQEAPAVGNYKPGVRPLRPDTVTLTNIRSNKVRYDENETATTQVTLVNTSGRACAGTLIALMHLDLDDAREITRTAFTVGAGETKPWSFSYNVGPETYGRGIEVRFADERGNLIDSWQEYYAVAAEWFRVQQHTHAGQTPAYEVNPWVTYYNQAHYFAHEPTDFGVHSFDAEVYLSGQAGYQVNQADRQAQMDFNRNFGIQSTFYQTFAFCGQMGYEEMRKHPEYVLYDENGQPAVDPIYGGYPNPMELAAPLEIGPKREVKKPHLDRRYTPWQHCAANFALEEAVVYQTECIKKYAEEHRLGGIYIDGNMGVLKGYNHDGTPNVPSGQPEDFAKLGARNHRIFSERLKRDNPHFGTWYNWGYRGVEWAIGVGLTAAIGSGTGARGDVGDENIRAATAWKNVMLLDETGSFLKSADPPNPREFLEKLIEQRDFAVQKWGANTIIGYSFVEPHVTPEEPGPSKWAWATLNYLGAQLIATQIHYAAGFLPSYRPMLQFTTRFSRLLWAPDLKVLPDAERVVQVSAPEEIAWKRLVYRRETPEGYDLIVHLVRLPPTERWDITWVDEPEPWAGVRVTAHLGSGQLRQAQALRPYQFEEEQQVVQTVLEANGETGEVSVEVPPFRYHTMVVLRIKTK